MSMGSFVVVPKRVDNRALDVTKLKTVLTLSPEMYLKHKIKKNRNIINWANRMITFHSGGIGYTGVEK